MTSFCLLSFWQEDEISMFIKCKKFRCVALFTFFENILWLTVMLSVLLCACITRWCQIICLLLEFLRKTCEEPNTEHLVKMVYPLVLSFVHIYTVVQKGTVCAWREGLYLVTLCIFHSFVWAGRYFHCGEWIRVSTFFYCGCWLNSTRRADNCDSSSSCSSIM